MNKQNRKELSVIRAEISSAKARLDPLVAFIDFEDWEERVETMGSDEQEKFDNMSEGLQQGEKGQAIEAAATSLNNLKELLTEAKEAWDTLRDKLEDIEGWELEE